MIDYKVYCDPVNKQFFIESDDIVEGSVAVDIPDSDSRKNQFISLFLHKADVEEGLRFLYCISTCNHALVNQALFMSALSNMVKCFQGTLVCKQLDEKRFIKECPIAGKEFERFKSWRNKHFIHDENNMREAIAFLIVAPEGHEHTLGGPPSVVWNRVAIDYLKEGRKLEGLMEELLQYIRKRIDDMGKSMLDEYNARRREELLSYGMPKIELATASEPAKTRNRTAND